jgi:hypothetical protein
MRTLTFRTRIAVIVCGYLMVIVIFAIFLTLQALPESLYGVRLERLAPTERFAVSVIVVAPVILGLLWDRVKGLKVGEIELVLEEVTPTINMELASAIQNSQSSQTMDLVNLIAAAIAQIDLRLVEVNLRCRPYWWTTRLFLLAALTQEYTNVERLIFVKYDALRIFVGAATPASVRRALGAKFPQLETVFTGLFTDAGPHTAESKQEEVQQIGFGWPYQMFSKNAAMVPEPEFRQKISALTLCEWLGLELETEARQWSGGPPSKRLYVRILGCQAPFVPLLIGPRLAKVVDRSQLVECLAIAAVM